jgi:polysaccharide deacetylase family protein (PEP-CTERM system associated)
MNHSFFAEPVRAVVPTRQYFTVDVEEYFNVVALAKWAPMERWASFESRVERSIDALLALMAERNATGTFFIVGWVAERHPEMVRRIVAAGHEIASHTYDHVRITHQSRDAFRESVRRTKALLEAMTGVRVVGFRAPSFSIVRGEEWALDVLIEEGHEYDSSLFPVRRRGYGYVGGGRDPYWIERPAGRLMEYPPVTLRALGQNWPAAGGAYFRLLPPALVHAALADSESRGVSGAFYIHPWEWDPGQPRFAVPFPTRVRHYGGQSKVLARLDDLMKRFSFSSIRDATPVTPGVAPRIDAALQLSGQP